MALQYERPLQSTLFGTLGRKGTMSMFEATALSTPTNSIIGYVTPQRFPGWRPVYTGTRLGPDISTLKESEREFWVMAQSVWNKGRKPVLQQITREDLFAVWDCEGKLESSQWTEAFSCRMLKLRLMSPPAKIIRSSLYTACESFLAREESGDGTLSSADPLPVGKTEDVPFSPSELNANARVAASMVDGRDADLSFRAEPKEIKEVGEARQVMCRFAVLWWYHHKKEETELWLASL